MAEKGWRLLEHGKSDEAKEYDQFPFVVMHVVQESGAVSMYVHAERYSTKEQAVARASFMNENGRRNVIVFEEIAFCIRKEPL